MRFGIYTEMQFDEVQESHAQVYDETMEQIVNADRLGYDYYATIEHFSFERFGISANPLAFFAAAAQKTSQIVFRTLVHVLPIWNPVLLASQIAQMDYLTGCRYEFGVGRGHGWLWNKAGVPIADSRARYAEALEIVLGLLKNPDGFSFDGEIWKVDNARCVPRPLRQTWNIVTGGTSNSSYELAGANGFILGVPFILPLEPLRPSVDIYRAACEAHGHTPRVQWGHALYLDEDLDTAKREAEHGLTHFFDNNATPTAELPPLEELERGGYGFYASGALQQLAAKSFDEAIADDLVWVGDPAMVIEKIEAAQDAIGPDLAEFTLTVNPGGTDHWKAIKAQELFAREVMPHFRAKAKARQQAAVPA